MAYPARDLITKSWFLSSIIARNLDGISGDQINDGLSMLNDLLNFQQVNLELVPYYQYITFDCVPGQENYYLPNVSLIESCTFNLGDVRYPMNPNTRRQFYGSGRVDDIHTLPFAYNFDRSLGGGNLSMYFIPDNTYPIKAMVKLFFTDVTLDTDLTDITSSFVDDGTPNFTTYSFVNGANQGFDTSYIEFLRYALARYMCSEYGIIFNPQSEHIYQSLYRKLMYLSPPDVSVKKASLLQSNRTGVINLSFVNLADGWVTG